MICTPKPAPARPLPLAALVVAIALGTNLPVFAQNTAQPTGAAATTTPTLAQCSELADFAPRWQEAFEGLGVAGCSLVVVRGDEVLLLHTMGIRDPRNAAAVDPDTMFYIASCTKPYLATGVAALVDDGKLDWDAPAGKYLPRFALPDADLTAKVTLRDLACHRFGIQHPGIVLNDAFTGQITEDRYYRLLAQYPAANKVAYTNVHFTLLGRVLTAVTQKDWRDVLDQRLFQPAGMTRTTGYASRMYGDANVAWPLIETSKGWQISTTIKTDRTMHAAGGLGTTARDLGQWLKLHLNGGKVNGRSVVAEAAIKEMQRPQSQSEPRGKIRSIEGFGLGWQLGKYRGRPYVTHGGGYIGTAAYVGFLPEEQLGVGILCNSADGAGAFIEVGSIDIFDRLLNITGEADLLPRYLKRAKREREKRTSAPPPSNPVAAGKLSLPPAAYTGRYGHEDYGDLEVRLIKDELSIQFGDMALTLAAGGNPNEFRALMAPGDNGIEGFFETNADKTTAVYLMQSGERLKFDRR